MKWSPEDIKLGKVRWRWSFTNTQTPLIPTTSSSKVFQVLISSVDKNSEGQYEVFKNEKEISERTACRITRKTSHRLTAKDLQEDLATPELWFSVQLFTDVCTNKVFVGDKTVITLDSVIKLCWNVSLCLSVAVCLYVDINLSLSLLLYR